MAVGRPMSVIVCQHKKELTFHFGLVVRTTTQTWEIHQVQEDGDNGVRDPHGYKYYPIKVNQLGQTISNKCRPSLSGCNFHTFAVMLPNLWKPKLDKVQFYSYAFVAEDWEHLKDSNTWTRARPSA